VIKGVVLGFDYGAKRIGVAIGQALTGSARPLTILKARADKPDWTAISQLIEQWQPVALVVGLPVHMDGTAHDITARAQRFGNQLTGRYNLPVHYADERLTTYAANQELREQGKTGEPDDALAAQLILQGWLDEMLT